MQQDSTRPRYQSLAARLMAGLAVVCDRAGWPIVIVAVVGFLLSVGVTVRGLGFETDRNALIGSDAPYYQRYLQFKKEFPSEDDIVIAVSGGSPAINRRAVVAVGDMLRADPQHFTDVFDKLDLGFVRRRVLLFMSVPDLLETEKRLKDVMPFLKRMLADPGLVPLFVSINDEIQAFVKKEIDAALHGGNPQAARNSGGAPDIAASLPMLSVIMSNMADSVGGNFTYHSPWARMFSSGSDPRMQDIPGEIYTEFQNGHMYLVLVKPNLVGSTSTADVLDVLKARVAEMKAKFPGVDIGLTGEPVLETDEMAASQRDSTTASLISLVGVVILFVLTFGTLSRPAMATISLVLAMGWTMGFTTLAIGHLNIITVTCMPMLIGIGIDFGIQLIGRYEEERLHGHLPQEAMVRTMGGTGASIVTAAFTTAVSFISARFTGFKGIGELGVLTGAGLLLSAAAMLIVLPALLLIMEKRQMARGTLAAVRPSPLEGMRTFEGGLLAHPWAVLVLAGLFTAFCIAHAFDFSRRTFRVAFDDNLLNLQTRGIESVELVKRMDMSGSHSILFAAVAADSLAQARKLETALKKLPRVADVESAVPLFPEDQARKLKVIPRIEKVLAQLPELREPLPPISTARLDYAVADLRSIFFLVYPEARKAGEMAISRSIRTFVLSADLLLERMDREGSRKAAQALYRYQNAFFHDLADKLGMIGGSEPLQAMTVEALPPLLRRELIGTGGKFLLRVFPKEDIWDGGGRRRFLDDVRRVEPDVTGSPVMMEESTRLLRESYQLAAVYALAAIVVLVILHFRSLLATLLALTPLVLGLSWMLGVMGFFNIPFNPANYLVLPLILGISVANGIYIVRRYQEEGSPAIFSVSTGRAILLSNLTAMIGFASLMIAKYQGIMTLGLVMTLGIGTCVLASLLVLPVILQILGRFQVRV